MGRHKKVTSEPKSPKCASGRRMPVTSGSGNVKGTNKSKKKGASGEGKGNGEASTGRGSVKAKTESAPAPPPPIVATSTISTSTRIITTPSRYSFPFLRSTVKKPAKVESPPPGPSQEDIVKEKPKAERKRWEAWSNQDKNLFFEAVAEHGKDFESIQRYIGQRHKRLGYPPNQNKNKDQVRHLYYRTCHKLLKYITPIPNQPRVSNELFALVNYGELRKKLKGGLTAKSGLKLDELVSKGSTSIRFKGRNLKLKTPVCKALKKLKSGDKTEEKPTKLPARVLLELQPRSNAAWAEVQGVAHNPRLRLVVPLQKDMGSLLSFLSEKWTPHSLRLLHTLKPEDKSNFNQVQIHVPKGCTITPYKKLHGRFLHANTKTPFTLVSDEPVPAEESPSKDAQTPPKEEVGIDIKEDLTETFLHPELDNNMEVDLLGNHHPADHMMQDTASLPSMFGDGNSIGDLLSNMSNGSLGQTSDNLTFSNLSLSLSGNPNSLAPPTNNILMHSDSMETDDAPSSSIGGAGDGLVNGASIQDSIKEEKMEVVEMEEEEKEMDVLLKEGLTAVTARGITATEIYLMMGQPETLKFEYDFVKKKPSVNNVSTNHMMSKLVDLAKSSYVEAANPKQYVSVGVVTSPIRTNTPPSKSQHSSTNRSPSTNTRSPRGTGTKGNTRGTNPTTSSKTHGKSTVASKSDANDKNEEEEEEDVHFAVPKAAAPVSVRRNQEPSHAEEGQQVLNQLEQMKRPAANFLLPRMKKRQRGVKPLVVQRTILPRPLPQENVADNMLSMAIINSSQANMGHFMPIKVSMSSLGTVVSPRGVPRPIKPNVTGISTIAGVGKTITKTVIAPTPGATKTVVRRIIPVNVTNSPENRGNILHSPSSFSPVHSPIMPSSPAPESQVNQVSTSQLATSPSPSAASPQPLGSSTPARGSPHMELADSSILNNTVIIDQRPSTPTQPIDNMDSSRLNTPIVVDKTHQSIPNMDSTLLGDSTLDQTLTTAITMADSSLLNSSMSCSVSAGQSSSSSGHSSSTTTHPTTSSLNISAPEISALLDISMPASENGDNISISLDSSTFKTFGRNISATSPNSTTTELLNSSTLSRDIGNVSPTSSPFKINSLGPEAQWYNGESLDISMSSLLGHLESPEKKDKTNPSTSTAVSLAPTLSLPPGLLSESSRDSIITRDVDSTLQVMLNENSIDYIAKFADLAAHISATPDTPHKINIIEKALVEESTPTEGASPQLELSSST